MKPVLFQIGAIEIFSFALMLAAAAIVFVWVSARTAERDGLPAPTIALSLATIYLAGLAGARALFVILNPEWWPRASSALVSLTPGGFASFGGFFGAVLALVVCSRVFRFPLGLAADSMAVGACLFGAVARIGCFLGGCCYGRPSSLPWGVVFPESSEAALRFGQGVAVHPAQLYESAFLLAVAAFSAHTPRHGRPGDRFLLLVAVFAAGRFFFEFVRGDGRVAAAGLTVAQWISLAVVTAAITGLVTLRRAGRLTPVGIDKSGR